VPAFRPLALDILQGHRDVAGCQARRMDFACGTVDARHVRSQRAGAAFSSYRGRCSACARYNSMVSRAVVLLCKMQTAFWLDPPARVIAARWCIDSFSPIWVHRMIT